MEENIEVLKARVQQLESLHDSSSSSLTSSCPASSLSSTLNSGERRENVDVSEGINESTGSQPTVHTQIPNVTRGAISEESTAGLLVKNLSKSSWIFSLHRFHYICSEY